MRISESYINRLQKLSGIILEKIELRASSGRSEEGTLSYFIEDYILNIGENFINLLDIEVNKNNSLVLEIQNGSIKISQNSLVIPFKIKNTENPNDIKITDYSLSIFVNIESSGNTVATLKYGTLNDEFNLQSKHSFKDVSDFIGEIIQRTMNVQQIGK